MAYQDHSGGYPPPRDSRDYSESQYPPPPGEEDDRARAYHHQRIPSAPGSVTLPSISPYGVPNGYAPDPRGYQQPPYREPPPGAYRDDRGYPPQDYGRGAPQHMAFSQSAPRQRTAIACRYCRRRKVSTKLHSAPWASFQHNVSRLGRMKSKSKQANMISPLLPTDSLLRLRSKPRRTMLQLPALPARMYIHSRIVSSTGVRSSSCRVSQHAQHGRWT